MGAGSRGLADLGSLEPGTHLCAFHPSSGALDRVAATFVGIGLAAGDRTMYVAGEDQAETLLGLLPEHVRAPEALSSGQLVLATFAEVYGAGRPEDLEAVADAFRVAAASSRASGFPGLRVAARMDDLSEFLGSADEVVRWERRSTDLQRELRVSSVCLYDSTRIDPAPAAFISDAHAGSAPADAGAPIAAFLAVNEPWGLRISGEVDVSNRDLLDGALRARAAVLPRLRVDVSELSFADVGTVSRLRSVASGLPEGGLLTLAGAPAALRHLLSIPGLTHDRLRFEP
jgi:ABC-type transporter Mla MlaB component